jgi:hypothetical protein
MDANGKKLYLRRNDAELLKLLARYHFLQPSHFHELTGRNIVSLRARLRQLFLAGYLQRQNSTDTNDGVSFDPPSKVYYLAEKGAMLAAHWGFLDEARWHRDKSRMTLAHDLEITEFHIALEKTFNSHLTSWEQYRAAFHDVLPDAAFSIGEQHYFLEVARVKGLTTNIEKARAYNSPEFREKLGHDFRVIFLLPTKERVLNLLKKLEPEFPCRHFYLTDKASIANITGSIFWTPKDYEEHTYGLSALSA